MEHIKRLRNCSSASFHVSFLPQMPENARERLFEEGGRRKDAYTRWMPLAVGTITELTTRAPLRQSPQLRTPLQAMLHKKCPTSFIFLPFFLNWFFIRRGWAGTADAQGRLQGIIARPRTLLMVTTSSVYDDKTF